MFPEGGTKGQQEPPDAGTGTQGHVSRGLRPADFRKARPAVSTPPVWGLPAAPRRGGCVKWPPRGAGAEQRVAEQPRGPGGAGEGGGGGTERGGEGGCGWLDRIRPAMVPFSNPSSEFIFSVSV